MKILVSHVLKVCLHSNDVYSLNRFLLSTHYNIPSSLLEIKKKLSEIFIFEEIKAEKNLLDFQ